MPQASGYTWGPSIRVPQQTASIKHLWACATLTQAPKHQSLWMLLPLWHCWCHAEPSPLVQPPKPEHGVSKDALCHTHWLSGST